MHRDVDACSDAAGPTFGDSTRFVGETLIGAVVGAAGGAVGGAIWGNPGMGAASGAAGGAAASLVSMVLRPHDPGVGYRVAVEQCLHDRGYQVAGWE